MSIVYGPEAPAIFIQQLADLPARVLVIAAVYEAYLPVIKSHQAYLGRALDIVGPVCYLYELVHPFLLYSTYSSWRS